MSFRNPGTSVGMRWSEAFLAPMLLLAASSAVAQTVNPVYSPNGPLTTNDCANTAAYNSTKMGTGQHVWYVAPGENGANNWTTLQGDPIDIANGNLPSKPLGGLQYAVSVTSPGDLVCLLSGTYTGGFAINKGGSATGGMVKFEVMPNAAVTISAIGSGILGGLWITASYVQVSGFTVLGPTYTLTWDGAVAAESDAADNPQYNTAGIVVAYDPNLGYPTHVNILQNIVYACPGGGIGALHADYVTISGNVIYDNGWYGSNGPSGISLLYSYDSNTTDKTTYKMVVTNNNVYNNIEFIPWSAQGKVSDGEGIIIDSNENKFAVGVENPVTYPAYSARTLVANNTVTGSGGAGILVFASAHVDVVNNSLFHNVVEKDHQPTSPSTVPIDGEMALSQAQDVNIVNNIFYPVGYSAPLFIAPPNYTNDPNMGTDNCSGCYADNNLYYSDTSQTNFYQGNGRGSNDADSKFGIYPNYVNLGGYPNSTYYANQVNLAIQSPYTSVLGYGTGWLAPQVDIAGKTRVVSSPYNVPLGAYTYP